MQDVTTQKDLIHALVILDTVVMEFLAMVWAAVNSPDITANTNHLQKIQLETGHKVFTRGVEDIFGGTKKIQNLSAGGGGRKKTTEPLGGTKVLVL